MSGKGYEPHLREHAITEYSVQWEKALEQTKELEMTFERLSNSMAELAKLGSNQELSFHNPLAHEWWLSFQETLGRRIKRFPDEAPEMLHEDSIAQNVFRMNDG